MRLKLVFILLFFLTAGYSSFAQTVTYSGENIPISKIFAEVKKQTGYSFIYKENALSGIKPVTVKVKNAGLTNFLALILKDTPLDFAIEYKTVTIFRKELPPQATGSVNKNLHSADRVISGFVTGFTEGEILSGASVLVKGTTTGTITNAQGMFSISVNTGDVLVFTYLGYIPREVKISEPMLHVKELRIVLQQTDHSLQAIQVVNKGYYTESKQLSTGSVSKVSAKEIEKQPVTNVMSALEGRVAGMQIVQSSGSPGAGFSVLIRGRNSIASGNDPLYIIDGVPFSSQSLGDPNVSKAIPGTYGGLNPLNTLNPSDILSIEILKDADATAIYGSRGANGVVLITTKKGGAGQTKVDLNFSTGYSEIARKMKLMNTEQYLAMRKEAFTNDGASYRASDYDINGTWDQNRYTDWQKELIGGKARTYNFQGAISGGSQLTQFLIRGSYQSETSVMPGDSKYGRSAVLFNLVHRSENDRFHLTFSGSFSADNNNNIGIDLTRAAATLPPNAPALYNEDGSLNWANSTWDNPLSNLLATYRGKTRNLTTNANLDYRLLKGLTVKVSLGYNDYRLNELRADPSTIYRPSYGLGSESSSARSTTGLNESYIIEPQINWKKGIGKGSLDVIAGTSFQQQQGETQSIFAFNFPSNRQIFDFTAAKTQSITGRQVTIYKYQAVYGRVNFNWEKKYVLNLTARRDGSSRFGPDRQFANFGAAGAAWIFSEENFIQNALPFLSFGKLRGSYGVTGNDQIGDYQFLDTYASNDVTYQGSRGLTSQRLYNPDFGWETNYKLETALELGFAEDRINMSAAYYRNRSSNQLVGIPLPGITGFTTVLANLGATVQNKGWEFELRTSNVQKKLFQWTSSFNITIPQNKLLSFPGLERSTYANQYIIGFPITILHLYNFAGYDPVKGKYLFLDVNKDGKLSSTEDRTAIKDLAPTLYGGLNNSFSFGQWQVDVFLQFVQQKRQSFLAAVNMPGGMQNMLVASMNHYPVNGDNSLVQRYSAVNAELSTAQSYFTASDKSIVDGSFIRLKNVSVSYKLKENWISKAKCRLFVQGQNLLTFTKYVGGDPESTVNYLPALRTITGGLQFTF